jgi:mRNA interferase MazF
MNKHLRTITIAPITSKSKDYITRVKFELDGNVNWIVLDQIRTIDVTRIIKINGGLEIKEIRKVKSIIKETFVD